MAALDRNIVKSAGRGFAILEAFERHRHPLTLAEIARELGYPKSSAAALLKSLVLVGYLSYDHKTYAYFPTTRVNTLGSWIPARLASDGADLALMQEVSDACGEAIVLCAQSDVYSQYLHVIDSTIDPCVDARVGTLRPIASTGTGIVLLSMMNDAEIDGVIRRINHASGRRSLPRIDAAVLKARIDETRIRGHLFTSHSSGASSLALPLRPMATRRMVLGVIGPTNRLQAKLAAVRARLVQYSGKRSTANATPAHAAS